MYTVILCSLQKSGRHGPSNVGHGNVHLNSLGIDLSNMAALQTVMFVVKIDFLPDEELVTLMMHQTCMGVLEDFLQEAEVVNIVDGVDSRDCKRDFFILHDNHLDDWFEPAY